MNIVRRELLSVLGCLFSVASLSVISFSVMLNKMIRDVTDLEIYRLGLELLEPVYELANLIPMSHRKLKYQLIDCAEKIPPQIAEGFGKKRSPREFCRFLSMALGSSDEVITHIREVKIVAKTHTKINPLVCDDLIDKYKTLSKKINTLLTTWSKYS